MGDPQSDGLMSSGKQCARSMSCHGSRAGFVFANNELALYQGISMIVASAFGTEADAIFAPTRSRARTALARQVAVYLAHVIGSKTYTEIGEVFGRDRTTAAHACRVVEDHRDDPCFDRMLEQLEQAAGAWLSWLPTTVPADAGEAAR